MHASTSYLAYIPSPSRGVWYVGPIPIRAYAVFIIAGIILAIWWGERRWVARGGAKGTIMDVAVFAVPFGLVGARLYHVATDWWRYFKPGENPWDAFKIWDGGIGIPGAIAVGAIGAWIACRRKHIPLPAIADTIAPGIAAAQAIGRIGNYFNQELYGGPTTLPWGLEIFRRVNPATGQDDNLTGVAVNHTPTAIVHPTFLYELIWDVLVAAVVVFAVRRYRLGHGRGFALYVGAYAFGRFFIELMRSDEATRILGIRINDWMMGLLFVAAIVYIVLAAKRGEPEDIAALTAGQKPPAGPSDHDDGAAPGEGDDEENPSTPTDSAAPAATDDASEPADSDAESKT
ncbi:MAG: prolipoprotein diacylglyceryl transferase [Sciscionella sp.]|nr:prolipoprotein diacylglyceryl transferase [Sciscionella sp.]